MGEMEKPFVNGAKVETMLRDIDRHRKAVRAHDLESIEATWEKCERWMPMNAANALAALRAENERLREALQVAEAFISVAMPHYAKERAEAVDEILPLIRAALKGETP